MLDTVRKLDVCAPLARIAGLLPTTRTRINSRRRDACLAKRKSRRRMTSVAATGQQHLSAKGAAMLSRSVGEVPLLKHAGSAETERRISRLIGDVHSVASSSSPIASPRTFAATSVRRQGFGSRSSPSLARCAESLFGNCRAELADGDSALTNALPRRAESSRIRASIAAASSSDRQAETHGKARTSIAPASAT